MWQTLRQALGWAWRSMRGGGTGRSHAAPSQASGTAKIGGSAAAPGASTPKLRLGHAFWSGPSVQDTDDIRRVLEIVSGSSVLVARPPACVDAVSRAEALLCGGDRVIYAYSGCLHPKLGTIGLIISPNWANRALNGASRCDSGGLAGRYGAFAHVDPADIEAALISLSFPANGSWRGAFEDELTSSYASAHGYVAGDVPRHANWSDVRSDCIIRHTAAEGTAPDRRVWTWELRLTSAPRADEYEAIVVSPEAFKRLEELRRGGADVPAAVRVVHGTVTAAGVHYFHEGAVTELLTGAHAHA